MIGVRKDGQVVLLTVDAPGLSLCDVARLCVRLGCRTALELNGGGSSTMLIRDTSGDLTVANRPIKGIRPVANALILRPKTQPGRNNP